MQPKNRGTLRMASLGGGRRICWHKNYNEVEYPTLGMLMPCQLLMRVNQQVEKGRMLRHVPPPRPSTPYLGSVGPMWHHGKEQETLKLISSQESVFLLAKQLDHVAPGMRKVLGGGDAEVPSSYSNL